VSPPPACLLHSNLFRAALNFPVFYTGHTGSQVIPVVPNLPLGSSFSFVTQSGRLYPIYFSRSLTLPNRYFLLSFSFVVSYGVSCVSFCASLELGCLSPLFSKRQLSPLTLSGLGAPCISSPSGSEILLYRVSCRRKVAYSLKSASVFFSCCWVPLYLIGLRWLPQSSIFFARRFDPSTVETRDP